MGRNSCDFRCDYCVPCVDCSAPRWRPAIRDGARAWLSGWREPVKKSKRDHSNWSLAAPGKARHSGDSRAVIPSRNWWRNTWKRAWKSTNSSHTPCRLKKSTLRSIWCTTGRGTYEKTSPRSKKSFFSFFFSIKKLQRRIFWWNNVASEPWSTSKQEHTPSSSLSTHLEQESSWVVFLLDIMVSRCFSKNFFNRRKKTLSKTFFLSEKIFAGWFQD